MSRALGGNMRRFIAAAIVALIVAAPLVCAAHSLHASESSQAAEGDAGDAGRGDGQEGHRHDHSEAIEELCNLAYAIAPTRTGVHLNSVSLFVSSVTPRLYSFCQDVPQPIPIQPAVV